MDDIDDFFEGDIVKVDGGVGEVLHRFRGVHGEVLDRTDGTPLYTVQLRSGGAKTYAGTEMLLLDSNDYSDDPHDYLGEYGEVQQGVLDITDTHQGHATKATWWHNKMPTPWGKGKGGYALKPHCNHWMVPFEIDAGKRVYLSGHSTPVSVSKGKAQPTAGVYLDSGWIRERGATLLTNTAIRDDCRDDERAVLYVPWPDMGVIPYRTLSAAVVWSLTHIGPTESKLEIGCVGGHGRTGTMLGAILIYHGRNGTEAIDEVRKRYCDKAIETKGQEELLHSLYEGFKDMQQQERE